jgi:hypothetical protein
MVSFGVVKVEPGLTQRFFGQVRPISEHYDPAALAIARISREEHMGYADPREAMGRLRLWLAEVSRGEPKMISDNPGFDFSWINYYCHVYTGSNPFGHSARRMGDLYAGLTRSFSNTRDWRALARTPHTHHPVDDAVAVAEALLAVATQYGLELPS